jgi:ABC-type iron transport system FetAB ATPase subunit
MRLRVEGLARPGFGPFGFEVAPGECLAVTGPSGAGKSVLLRMIADLDPHAGEAWLDGQARSSMRAAEWRGRVAYGAAEAGWWKDKVGEHFDVAPVAMAARLGLGAEIFAREVRLCSTGERQRLALLRLFARRAPVVLLDEPTGPLDPESVARVEEMLAEFLADGTAVVLVTHDLAQAARLGTAQCVLEHGRFR